MKFKRMLALTTAGTILSANIGYSAFASSEKSDIILLAEGNKVTVETESEETVDGVLIHAVYNDDKSLKSSETIAFSISSGNPQEITLSDEYKEGDGLFAWNSLEDMKSYSPTVTTSVVRQAQVADLGWSQFVAVQLANGYTLSDCTVEVDGVDVTSAVTPVTDDGSVVKWEITSLDPAELKVTAKDGNSRTVKLSDNENPTKPVVKNNTSAGYMIAYGPMAIWDYYLTVYDDNGNLRIEPSKTTFDINGTSVNKSVPASYSPVAEINDARTGSLTIMFNYNQDWEKEWFDSIKNQKGSVELVYYDDNKLLANGNLNFELKSDVPHGSGKVGEITIPLAQDNISNGRYYVRVKSDGHDGALVPVHIVAQEAPTLELTSANAVLPGDDVKFIISGMINGIKNPTVAAELTDPSGKTTLLTMIDDWYQIGNYLYLYNSEDSQGVDRNKTQKPGKYTLTVHSDGYKDMSAVFNVSEVKEPVIIEDNVEPLVDAVSSATYSGSYSSDGTAAGGGQVVSADIKFNADLLINAKILSEHLMIENEDAQNINNRWRSLTPIKISSENSHYGGYDWNVFTYEVDKAEEKGEYLNFSDFNKKNADLLTKTTVHSVKSVLENNLLGDIQENGDWIGESVPNARLVRQISETQWESADSVKVGENINYIFNDTTYVGKIESIDLNGYGELEKGTDYDIMIDKTNGLTLLSLHPSDRSRLNINQKNNIKITASGYKANTLYFLYERDMEKDLSVTAEKESYTRDENGTVITLKINGTQGDFLDYLYTISVESPDGNIAAKTVRTAAEGGDANYYFEKVAPDTVIITDKNNTLFAENGSYKITLVPAQYYNSLSTTVSVDGELKTAPYGDPYVYYTSEDRDGVELRYYALDFGKANKITGFSAWKSAITSVTINGKAYSEIGISAAGTLTRDTYKWLDSSDGEEVMRLFGTTAFNYDGENTVVIKASGYEDVSVTFNELKTLEPPTYTVTTEDKETYVLSFTGDKKDADKYIRRITSINVGGNSYFETTVSSKNIYKLITDENGLYIAVELENGSISEWGDTDIIINANGYSPLEYTIENGERPLAAHPEVNSDSLVKIPQEDNNSDVARYSVTFNGDNASDYISAITSVKVGETEYKDNDVSFVSGHSLADSHYRRSENNTVLDIAANMIADYNAATNITITADGYTDYTFTIDNSGKTEPDAPSVKSKTLVYDSAKKDYYRISFNDETSAQEYLKNITSVTVNETEYTNSPFSSYTKNVYRISTNDSGKGVYLDITTDSIPENKETSVTVIADGYKQLDMTIEKQELVTAPITYSSYEYSQKDTGVGNTPALYTLTFESENDEDVTQFLSRLESVSVGENEYTKTDTNMTSSSEKTYKISADKLILTADCIGEAKDEDINVNISLKAKGYENYSFTLTVAKPLTAPVTKVDAVKTDDAYHRVKFEGENIAAWLDKIISLKVQNTYYSPAADNEEITSQTSAKYKIVTDGNNIYMDIAAKGMPVTGSTTVTIGANGYKDYSFEIGSEETGLDAPNFTEIDKSNEVYYKIIFDSSASDFLSALKNNAVISVGENIYTKYSGYSDMKDSEYAVVSTIFDNYIMLGKKYVAGYGSSTDVSVKAEGYKTLIVTIDNSDVTVSFSPETSDITYTENDEGKTSYYNIDFKNAQTDAESIDKYLNNVTSVKVGDTEYKKSYALENFDSNYSYMYGTYSFDSRDEVQSNAYEFGRDTSKGKFISLRISDTAVNKEGKTTVTVSAAGYKDLTFDING
ncbi:MAG: DUF1533 domain-containing protein [Firmicutes bacterium]|nr:DUF1533 domain-containing protein [Bacillota bacterium]